MLRISETQLIRYGIEKNRKFLIDLYNNNELIEANKIFLKKTNAFIEEDYEMDVDQFSRLIMNNADIYLGFASANKQGFLYSATQQERRFSSNRISRIAEVNFPYNKKNFSIISRLFEKAFNKEIEKRITPRHQI